MRGSQYVVYAPRDTPLFMAEMPLHASKRKADRVSQNGGDRFSRSWGKIPRINGRSGNKRALLIWTQRGDYEQAEALANEKVFSSRKKYCWRQISTSRGTAGYGAVDIL